MEILKRFYNVSLRFKILSLYILGLLLMAIFGYGYFFYTQIKNTNREIAQIKKDINEQNKDMIKTAVYVAENIVNTSLYLYEKGIISEEKAKKVAIEELQSIKYGKSGYVWCMTQSGILLVDPPREDLVGKNVLGIRDKMHSAFFKQIQSTLSIHNSAFIEYYWNYPGIKDKQFKKLAYVKKVRTWNWIIGSGVYLKDIESRFDVLKAKKITELRNSIIESIMQGGILSSMVLLILFIFLNKIVGSIERVSEASKRLSTGDVDINMKFPEKANGDCLGKLIKNTNKYIENTYYLMHFKENIENQDALNGIYQQLAELLEEKFLIDNYIICSKIGFKFNVVLEKGDKIKKYYEFFQKCLKDFESSEKHKTVECNIDNNVSCLCIPIISNQSTVGMVYIITNEKNQEYIRENLKLLENFIKSVAHSINVKNLESALKMKSLRDELTGLHNRRFLNEVSQTLMSSAARRKIRIAVAMIDIDNFKKINDTYGHLAGDFVLKNVSHITKILFKRKSDMIIRYGGEEFLAVLPDMEINKSIESLEELRKSIESDVVVYEGNEIKITISVGCAFIPEDASELEEAIKYADMALYRAKNTGKNRVIRFSKHMIEDYKKEP